MIRPALLAITLMALPLAAQDFPPPAPQPDQQKCGKRTEVIYRLANQFLESQIALWLAPDGALMEVWGNPKTGTSTLLRTPPDKPTCMVDAGQGFQVFPYAPGDDV